jgi:hypothetical protein
MEMVKRIMELEIKGIRVWLTPEGREQINKEVELYLNADDFEAAV